MNKYKILQIKKRNKEFDWRFEDWETVQTKFSLKPYEPVYESKSNIEITNDNVYTFLEELFHNFNVGEKPKNYTGHSLSVSDLVEIENVGLFYCDSVGWQKISVEPLNKKNEGFDLKELEKALKKEITIPFKLECKLNDLKEISISFETSNLQGYTFEKLKSLILKVGSNYNLIPTIYWNLKHCWIYSLSLK